MINANALKEAIVSAGYSQESLVKLMDIRINVKGDKMNGRIDFTVSEIVRVCKN